MRGWIILIVAILLLGGIATGIEAVSVRAVDSIHTDKSVYVAGETINVYVTGENDTLYRLYVDGYYVLAFFTNSTGEAVLSFMAGDTPFNEGEHTLQLWLYGNIVATTNIEVRKGITLWPSKYTGDYTYLYGETMWVKIEGENNKTYILNITNETGVPVYPHGTPGIYITTNATGVAIFNITLNIGDDDYYLNLYNGSMKIQAVPFSVRSIEISSTIDRGPYGYYLLSERVHLYVSIYWMKTHKLLEDASYRWWIVDGSNSSLTFGPYASSQREFITEPLSFYSTPQGDKIQVNHLYYFKIEYEMENGTGRHYDEVEIPFYTSTLQSRITLNPLEGSISPGKDVNIVMYTYAGSSSIEGAKVDYLNITIINHWQILWNENYTNVGVTDLTGHTYFLWKVPSVDKGSEIIIKAQFSKGNDTSTATLNSWVHSDIILSIKTDKGDYLSGDTMDIQISSVTPEGVYAQGYEVWIISGSSWNMKNVLYYTYTANGHVTYEIPKNYSGNILIMAGGHYSDGSSIYEYIDVSVHYLRLSLMPSSYFYFNSGDQITLYSKVESNVIDVNTILYTILNDKGEKVVEAQSSTGNFTFTIPDGSSIYYFVKAEVIQGSYYSYATVYLEKYQGYTISVALKTKSSYQNGIYEPGQRIEIGYNISKYGNFTTDTLLLHWEIVGTNYSGIRSLNDSELNGSIWITIPKDLHGGYTIKLWISWFSSDVFGDWFVFKSGFMPGTVATININVENGNWSMQDVAGMPMLSLINLILVVIAIVIGIVAIIMLMRRGKATEFPVKKKGAPKPYNPEGEEMEESPKESQKVEEGQEETPQVQEEISENEVEEGGK